MIVKNSYVRNRQGCVGFYRVNESRKFWFREMLLLLIMLGALGALAWMP